MKPLFCIWILSLPFIACQNEVKKAQVFKPAFITSHIDSLRILNCKLLAQSYSENYRPTGEVPQIEKIPDSIISAFKTLRVYDKQNHEKFITLLFIKLYHSHLQCCHQSYDLRTNDSGSIDSTKDPLLFEFNCLTHYIDNDHPPEFISSGIAEDWIDKHPYLLHYDKILLEKKGIDRITDSISKGLYW